MGQCAQARRASDSAATLLRPLPAHHASGSPEAAAVAETPSRSVKAPLRLQIAAESLAAFYEWFATTSSAIGHINLRVD